MKQAVVDTSALVRLYIPDGPIPAGMEHILDQCERDEIVLLAPELLIVEVGQVLYKKWKQDLLSKEEVLDILNEITNLPIRLYGHHPLSTRALEIAIEYAITVYDANYLALAEKHGALLFTADLKLKKVAQKLGII